MLDRGQGGEIRKNDVIALKLWNLGKNSKSQKTKFNSIMEVRTCSIYRNISRELPTPKVTHLNVTEGSIRHTDTFRYERRVDGILGRAVVQFFLLSLSLFVFHFLFKSSIYDFFKFLHKPYKSARSSPFEPLRYFIFALFFFFLFCLLFLPHSSFLLPEIQFLKSRLYLSTVTNLIAPE